jgi:hypothetical protein
VEKFIFSTKNDTIKKDPFRALDLWSSQLLLGCYSVVNYKNSLLLWRSIRSVSIPFLLCRKTPLRGIPSTVNWLFIHHCSITVNWLLIGCYGSRFNPFLGVSDSSVSRLLIGLFITAPSLLMDKKQSFLLCGKTPF